MEIRIKNIEKVVEGASEIIIKMNDGRQHIITECVYSDGHLFTDGCDEYKSKVDVKDIKTIVDVFNEKVDPFCGRHEAVPSYDGFEIYYYYNVGDKVFERMEGIYGGISVRETSLVDTAPRCRKFDLENTSGIVKEKLKKYINLNNEAVESLK